MDFQVEAIAPWCAEVDDYDTERQEVIDGQGDTFPYTKGFWLLCHLVAAINPHDLDALDESLPLTKYTLDNLLGRKHTKEEYKLYFDNTPNGHLYRQEYVSFLKEDVVASEIISSAEKAHREAFSARRK